jgi:N-methylhydantoinase B
VEVLPVYGEVPLAAGETIRTLTSGGGGYGDPHTREPEAVADDVREGWVSRAKAREVYGVAVTCDGAIDEDVTAALRGR